MYIGLLYLSPFRDIGVKRENQGLSSYKPRVIL